MSATTLIEEGPCVAATHLPDPPPEFLVRGRLVRVASVRSEWYVEMPEPDTALRALREGDTRADLYTFIQRLPDTTPRFDQFYMEWDNVAAIPITTFDDWWTQQIPKSTRKHARRAERAGIEMREAPLDDALLAGIQSIYDETPLRQGRPFPHYRKSIEELRRSHGTFPDRRKFIGAYLGDELVGFISLIYAGVTARSVQVITKVQHQNKWPVNALFRKAVEICADAGKTYLVYGRYDYGKVDRPSLQAFKRENGFVKMEIPRYYLPLTLRGRLALAAGAHRGAAEMLPRALVQKMMDYRCRWYAWRFCSTP